MVEAHERARGPAVWGGNGDGGVGEGGECGPFDEAGGFVASDVYEELGEGELDVV